jgi:hypothetical protein
LPSVVIKGGRARKAAAVGSSEGAEAVKAHTGVIQSSSMLSPVRGDCVRKSGTWEAQDSRAKRGRCGAREMDSEGYACCLEFEDTRPNRHTAVTAVL